MKYCPISFETLEFYIHCCEHLKVPFLIKMCSKKCWKKLLEYVPNNFNYRECDIQKIETNEFRIVLRFMTIVPLTATFLCSLCMEKWGSRVKQETWFFIFRVDENFKKVQSRNAAILSWKFLCSKITFLVKYRLSFWRLSATKRMCVWNMKM